MMLAGSLLAAIAEARHGAACEDGAAGSGLVDTRLVVISRQRRIMLQGMTGIQSSNKDQHRSPAGGSSAAATRSPSPASPSGRGAATTDRTQLVWSPPGPLRTRRGSRVASTRWCE